MTNSKQSLSVEELLLAEAEKEREAWMRAYAREIKRGQSGAADACLSGANTVEQLIARMKRALRSRPPLEDNSNG